MGIYCGDPISFGYGEDNLVGCVFTSSVRNSTFCTRQLISTCRQRYPSRLILLNSVLCRKPHGSLPTRCGPGTIVTLLGPLTSHVIDIQNGYSARISRVILSFPILTSCTVVPLPKYHLFLARNRTCNNSGPPPVTGNSILLRNRARIPVYRRAPNN